MSVLSVGSSAKAILQQFSGLAPNSENSKGYAWKPTIA